MSQISLPIRILLVGSIAFLAAWFVLLKPGAGAETAATPATVTPAATTVPAKDPAAKATSAVGKTVQKAVAAKQTAEAAGAAAAGETSTASAATSAAAPATKAAAAPAAKPAKAKAARATGLPTPVAKAVAEHRVLVLLFWNRKAADDRLVHGALRGVDRHHGKVVLRAADVSQISRYASITRGVDVQQSPSVVVVDRKLHGELLTGYVDRDTIDQAVSDALRAR